MMKLLRVVALLFVALAPAATAWAAAPAPYTSTAVGPDQMGLSIGATAVSLSPPAGATFALITVEGAQIRWRDAGAVPTASAGQPLSVGTTLTTSSIFTIQFIDTGTPATIDVSYYR